MTIGTSILLIAVGAILKWAVNVHSSGFNIQTAGTILLIVGVIGLILSLIYTMWWSRRETTAYVDETRVARRPPPSAY